MGKRQRFIHPDFWTDPTIGGMAPVDRLFFVGCFSNADDEGRLLGSPAYLRSTIFPYDDFPVGEVRAMRDRVVASCKNLILYNVGDVEYLSFASWRKYQTPRYAKASRLPPLPSNPSAPSPQPCDQADASLPQACGKIDASLHPNGELGFGFGFGNNQGPVILVGDTVNSPTPEPLPPKRNRRKPPSGEPLKTITPERVVELWHQHCPDLPSVLKLTPQRRETLKVRFRDSGDTEEWWTTFFQRVQAGPHLRGENDRGWKADFDWVIKSEGKVASILEGKYDYHPPSPRATAKHPTPPVPFPIARPATPPSDALATTARLNALAAAACPALYATPKEEIAI